MLDQARGLYGTGRLEEAEAALVTAISLVSGCVAVGASAPLSLELAAAASAAPLLKLLGDVRVDAFRYDDAVAAYDAAIEAGGASAGGALFGRANAFEGKALLSLRGGGSLDSSAADALYAAAVRDYTACLESREKNEEERGGRKPSESSSSAPIVVFERAQALRALRRWRESRADYENASALFLAAKDKKRADIAAAQAAFAAFEEGDSAYAIKSLETLARRLYSSDVRAALAAAYYRSGDAARAEDAWLGLCELRDAQCGKYNDTEWLLEYRRWTPALARAMQDFLAMR